MIKFISGLRKFKLCVHLKKGEAEEGISHLFSSTIIVFGKAPRFSKMRTTGFASIGPVHHQSMESQDFLDPTTKVVIARPA